MIDQNSKFKFTRRNVGIRKCKEDDFMINDKFIISKPEKSPSRYSLCPKSLNLDMDDDFVQNGSRTIEIQIFPCQTNCRPDFIEILESGKLSVILGHSESSQSLDNLKTPFVFNYNTNRWFHILKTKTFSRKLYISKTSISTNMGLFKDKIVKSNSIRIDTEFNEDNERDTSSSEYADLYGKSSPPFISIVLYSSKHITQLHRTYMSVSTLLSKIGSITSMITLIISVIYGMYNKFSLKLNILNNSSLNHYRNRTKIHFSILDVITFNLYNILSLMGLGNCFSLSVRLKANVYFMGKKRAEECLDVKQVIRDSIDVGVMRSVLLKPS